MGLWLRGHEAAPASEEIPRIKVEVSELDKEWRRDCARDAAWEMLAHLGYVELLADLEVKSPVTYNHCVMVADILIADLLVAGVDETEYLAKAYVAAVLHDIGKLDPEILPLVNSSEPFRFDEEQRHKLIVVREGHTLAGPEILKHGRSATDPVARRARRLAELVSRYHHTDAQDVLSLAKSLDDKSAGFVILAIQLVDMLQAGTDLNRMYIAEKVRDGTHDLVYEVAGGEYAVREDEMRRQVKIRLGDAALAFYPGLALLAAADMGHYPTRVIDIRDGAISG